MSEWISVKDRLPDHKSTVVILMEKREKYDYVNIVLYDANKNAFLWQDGSEIKGNPRVKPVVMLNANGKFEMEFESSAEAARYIGGNGSNVWAVCNKRAETYKGKIFVYKDEWLIKEGYFNKEYLENGKE